jgi:type III pantothenate kinase
MNAAIDAGNTRIKVGLFDNDRLIDMLVFPSHPIQNLYAFLAARNFENCIISSVIELPPHIINYLRMKSGHLFEFDTHNRLPIENKYKTPHTLGKDRLALAVAGAARFPGKDVLVISAGTCITYNFVSAKGAFMGGAISPGLEMRYKAMHEGTSELPMVETEKEAPEIDQKAASQSIPLIGNNTESSIRSGVVNGIVFEIEGYVNQLKKKYKNCGIILSGGDSRYLADHLTIETDVEPDLALAGLNLILKFNAPEKN